MVGSRPAAMTGHGPVAPAAHTLPTRAASRHDSMADEMLLTNLQGVKISQVNDVQHAWHVPLGHGHDVLAASNEKTRVDEEANLPCPQNEDLRPSALFQFGDYEPALATGSHGANGAPTSRAPAQFATGSTHSAILTNLSPLAASPLTTTT